VKPIQSPGDRVRDSGVAPSVIGSHRHPGLQALKRSTLGEFDLHRHTTHDLGEVAGGVLGRKDAELRATCRRGTGHHTAVPDILEGIYRNLHRMAHMHVLQLGLLEIGLHEQIPFGDQIGQQRARLHQLAHLHMPLGQGARDWRMNPGPPEIYPRDVECCLGNGDRGLAFAQAHGNGLRLALCFRLGCARFGKSRTGLRGRGLGVVSGLKRSRAVGSQILLSREVTAAAPDFRFRQTYAGATLLHAGRLYGKLRGQALVLGSRCLHRRFGMLRTCLIVAVVDDQQEITGLHRLIVAKVDFPDVAGHSRTHLGHVRAQVGIIRALERTHLAEPVVGREISPAEQHREHAQRGRPAAQECAPSFVLS